MWCGIDLFSKSSTNALVVLLFLSAIYFLEVFDRYLVAVSPIPYIDYTSFEYSIISGPAFTIVYTFAGLLISLKFAEGRSHGESDKQDRDTKITILAASTFVFSSAFFCTALATTFWEQCVIRMVMGLTQSIITPFSTSIISDLFPQNLRGSAFSVFNIGTYLAFSISLSLGTYLYVQYGWRIGYIFFGLLGVVFAVLIIPLLRCLLTDEDGSEYSDDSVDININTIGANGSADTSGNTSSSSSDSDNNVVRSRLHDPLDVPRVFNITDPSNISVNSMSSGRDGISSSSSSSSSSRQPSLEWSIRRVWTQLVLVTHHWSHMPGLFMLSLATGFRLGAGYIWAGYTSVFYADLFTKESSSSSSTSGDTGVSCTYSYSDTVSAAFYLSNDAVSAPAHYATDGSVCNSDYRYCVDGECSALVKYPWHNKGMSSLQFEEFMSWVPLLGSALGSLLGGFLSDYLIKKQRERERNRNTHAKRPSLSSTSDRDRCLAGEEEEAHDLLFVPLLNDGSSLNKSSVTGCDGDGSDGDGSDGEEGRDAGGSSNSSSSGGHNENIGCKVGGSSSSRRDSDGTKSPQTTPDLQDKVGIISGRCTVAAGVSQSTDKLSIRILLTAIGTVSALPLVSLSLFAGSPGCFLLMTLSGAVGELYLSQSLAVITDVQVVPPEMVPQSVAFFMFVTILIGGNAPLLIPIFESLVGFSQPVTVHFTAAETIPFNETSTSNSFSSVVSAMNFAPIRRNAIQNGDINEASSGSVWSTTAQTANYSVENPDARVLQHSMLYALGLTYAISAVFYLICYWQMNRAGK